MSSTPLYGTLVSFGGVTFDTNTGYLSTGNRTKSRSLAFLLGKSLGVDENAGGVVPYKSQENTFVLWLLAPDGTAEADCAAAVEAKYLALDAYFTESDTDGLSKQTQTLTAKLADGTEVTCQASLVDLSIRETDRYYSSLKLNVVFQYLTEWS